MKRTYWIRTGAGRGETEPKWIQLSGQEFYAFIHSEEGNGRYFIRLFDEMDPECEDVAGGLPERLARGEDLESLIAEKDERERLRNAVALLETGSLLLK